MFKWVIDFYKMGLYNEDNLKAYVRGGLISANDFKSATGVDYHD
ncbi:XkdX family protein [Lacticaseibacillus brantae]|nr:XkdX family protein [Lacticaseibacillus brantae]